MDIIDTAAEIEELQRNAALSAHRIDRNAVSAEHCEECGEDIPAPRRALQNPSRYPRSNPLHPQRPHHASPAWAAFSTNSNR